MSARRPQAVCKWCGKLFAVTSVDGHGYRARSVSIANIDKTGLFCTLRCAARFGVRAAIAKVQ